MSEKDSNKTEGVKYVTRTRFHEIEYAVAELHAISSEATPTQQVAILCVIRRLNDAVNEMDRKAPRKRRQNQR